MKGSSVTPHQYWALQDVTINLQREYSALIRLSHVMYVTLLMQLPILCLLQVCNLDRVLRAYKSVCRCYAQRIHASQVWQHIGMKFPSVIRKFVVVSAIAGTSVLSLSLEISVLKY